MDSIYNKLLNRYKSNYDSSRLLDLTNIIVEYNSDDWKQYIKFNNMKYNRIKLNKYSNDVFEFVLICWSPNQESPIHNHPTNGCIMKVLDGSLEETLYDTNMNMLGMSIYNKNNTSYIDNMKGIHKIKSNDFSVSLHIYSPPNYISKCYN